MTWRFEPVQVPGKGWQVNLAHGNRKKGTKVTYPITEPVYTLAQAQAFISNNKVSDWLADRDLADDAY